MTTPQSRHRGDIKTPGVTLDDHVEFANFAIFRHAQSLLQRPSPVNRRKATVKAEPESAAAHGDSVKLQPKANLSWSLSQKANPATDKGKSGRLSWSLSGREKANHGNQDRPRMEDDEVPEKHFARARVPRLGIS